MERKNLSNEVRFSPTTGELLPDLDQAERFLKHLDQTEEKFVFQTFDDLKSRKDPRMARLLFGTLAELADDLTKLNRQGAGVFVTVNRSRNGGRKKADIVEGRAIFREADAPDLPLLPVEPSLVIESSPGKKHEYFLLSEQSADLATWDDTMAGMVERFGSDPNAKDRARVLRIPGFYHQKDPDHPHLVNIVHEGGSRYSLDALAEVIRRPEKRKEAPSRPQTSGLSPYTAQALEMETCNVRQASEGDRNATLNRAAFSLGQLVAGGELAEGAVINALTAAAESAGLTPGEIVATIRSGLESGKQHPRQAPEGNSGQTGRPGPPKRGELVITESELVSARLTPTCIVKHYLYADVASFSAPGGTGKTTLVLYEAINIALGRSVHGLEVVKPGWTLIITAEDHREMLVGRIREIMTAMGLTEEQRRTVLSSVLPWDVAGEQRKLITSHDGNIVLTAMADEIVEAYGDDPPVLVVIDPLVSFGVSESMINDNEQGIITACRRIVKGLDCCVRVIAHTGKANARQQTLDQYSSRGGSALSDGARMVAVLQTWTPDGKLTPPAGCTIEEGSSIAILARPKLSYSPPNLPNLWIRRTGYIFEAFTDYQVSQEERDAAILDQVERFLTSEVQHGHKHSKTSLENALPNLARAEARKAITILMAHGRIIEADLPRDEVKTRRKTYLTTAAGFGRIPKTGNSDAAGKTPGNNAAAYRENNGGIITPPIFPPFSNVAAIARQDSAGLAGLGENGPSIPSGRVREAAC